MIALIVVRAPCRFSVLITPRCARYRIGCLPYPAPVKRRRPGPIYSCLPLRNGSAGGSTDVFRSFDAEQRRMRVNHRLELYQEAAWILQWVIHVAILSV